MGVADEKLPPFHFTGKGGVLKQSLEPVRYAVYIVFLPGHAAPLNGLVKFQAENGVQGVPGGDGDLHMEASVRLCHREVLGSQAARAGEPARGGQVQLVLLPLGNMQVDLIPPVSGGRARLEWYCRGAFPSVLLQVLCQFCRLKILTGSWKNRPLHLRSQLVANTS